MTLYLVTNYFLLSEQYLRIRLTRYVRWDIIPSQSSMLKYGNIHKIEGGQIYLSFVTILWSPWQSIGRKRFARAKVHYQEHTLAYLQLHFHDMWQSQGCGLHHNIKEIWLTNLLSRTGMLYPENPLEPSKWRESKKSSTNFKKLKTNEFDVNVGCTKDHWCYLFSCHSCGRCLNRIGKRVC